MRFPLLIGARPAIGRVYAKVPLGRGKWRITANHTSSELVVSNGNPYGLLPGGAVVIEGPTIVYIICATAGDENGIDAFAELINDVDTVGSRT